MKIKSALSFDDVLLRPKHSDILSRSDIDISTNLRDVIFGLPVISSPMDTVTESSMATSLDSIGGLGIIHRYNSIKDQSSMIHEAHAKGSKNIGFAVGVSGDYLDRAKAGVMAGANVICVDIALSLIHI